MSHKIVLIKIIFQKWFFCIEFNFGFTSTRSTWSHRYLDGQWQTSHHLFSPPSHKPTYVHSFKEKMWVMPVFRELGYHSVCSLNGQRFKALNLCISVTNWDMDVKQKTVLRLAFSFFFFFFASFWNDFWVKFCNLLRMCFENKSFEIGIGYVG